MKISCGVLILNEQNELLMGHSTGNKFYDIPKGMLEENESPLVCATRETLEETSLALNPELLKDLGQFPYNKEKQLHLFLYQIAKADINLEKLICNSFFECFYSKKMKPEVDSFEWISVDDFDEKCAKSMAKLLNKIKNDILMPKSGLIKP